MELQIITDSVIEQIITHYRQSGAHEYLRVSAQEHPHTVTALQRATQPLHTGHKVLLAGFANVTKLTSGENRVNCNPVPQASSASTQIELARVHLPGGDCERLRASPID